MDDRQADPGEGGAGQGGHHQTITFGLAGLDSLLGSPRVAGDQVVERWTNQYPVHGSVADPAIGYQLEQGRALAISLGAHQTRDLEDSRGSLAVALLDAYQEPVSDSLLARPIPQLANHFGGAVATADRPNPVDSRHRDTGCKAGHRRCAFQPIAESYAVTYDTAIALTRRSVVDPEVAFTRRALVDPEDTIDVFGSATDSIEAGWAGPLTQPALGSTGCHR